MSGISNVRLDCRSYYEVEPFSENEVDGSDLLAKEEAEAALCSDGSFQGDDGVTLGMDLTF